MACSVRYSGLKSPDEIQLEDASDQRVAACLRYGWRGRARVGRHAFERARAGRVWHQRRAARPVARGDLPLGESGRNRSDVRRGVQRPRHWIRARGPTRQGTQGVRESPRSEEHTSELQSLRHLVCRLLLEKKKNQIKTKR